MRLVSTLYCRVLTAHRGYMVAGGQCQETRNKFRRILSVQLAVGSACSRESVFVPINIKTEQE